MGKGGKNPRSYQAVYFPVSPAWPNHSVELTVPAATKALNISFRGDGCGRALIRNISAKRKADGPFKSMEDLFQRMGEGELNKRAVENFIKCGAADSFGYHRSELLAVYDSMMDSIASSRKKNLEGQMGLFGMLEDEDGI